MYGYADLACDVEDNGTPAPALHGVFNQTPEVLNLRKNRGLKQYFEMEPVHVGVVSGVEIKFMSAIHYWGRET